MGLKHLTALLHVSGSLDQLSTFSYVYYSVVIFPFMSCLFFFCALFFCWSLFQLELILVIYVFLENYLFCLPYKPMHIIM